MAWALIICHYSCLLYKVSCEYVRPEYWLSATNGRLRQLILAPHTSANSGPSHFTLSVIGTVQHWWLVSIEHWPTLHCYTIILYCTVLHSSYSSVLYCTVLWCTIIYYTIVGLGKKILVCFWFIEVMGEEERKVREGTLGWWKAGRQEEASTGNYILVLD